MWFASLLGSVKGPLRAASRARESFRRAQFQLGVGSRVREQRHGALCLHLPILPAELICRIFRGV